MMIALAAAAVLMAPPLALQNQIKADLEARMLDGKSARILWQPMRDDRIYCGFVNGKNSYGAYTGYRLFYVMLGSDQRVRLDSEGLGGLGKMMCERAGYATAPGNE